MAISAYHTLSPPSKADLKLLYEREKAGDDADDDFNEELSSKPVQSTVGIVPVSVRTRRSVMQTTAVQLQYTHAEDDLPVSLQNTPRTTTSTNIITAYRLFPIFRKLF